MFTEKLRSLLKFGPNSTRFKDIFDMVYLSDLVDRKKLIKCIGSFIFSDPGMKENEMNDVCQRVRNTFASKRYESRLTISKKNWLGMEIPAVFDKLTDFLDSLR